MDWINKSREVTTLIIQMILSFLLLFVWLPMIVIKFDDDNKDWVDKLFISLIHSTFFFIVIIHLLALVRLYETLSLMAVIVLSMIAVVNFNHRRQEVMTDVLTSSYDMLEHPNNWKQFLRGLPKRIVNRARMVWEQTLQSFRMNWFIYSCIIFTLIYGAYTRFKHSIIHYYFGASDPYVHLQLSKFLGENKMFDDGIYPYGFAAIISSIHKFFLIDTYTIVRFIGPIGGFLIVLSIIYAIRRIIGPYYVAIFISIFLYAVYEGLPVNLWRQISALSMEYATIFLLPGIALLIEYFRSKKMLYLILAGECMAITVFIHLYTAVALGIAYILICLCYWRLLFIRQILYRFITVMMTGGIIGLLPLILAFTLKSAKVEQFTYVTENIQTAQRFDLTTWLSVFNQGDLVVRILLVLSLLLLLYRAASYIIRRSKHTPLDYRGDNSFLFIFIIFYFIHTSEEYGLPVIIAADRFGVFFALSAVIAAAVLLKRFILDVRPFRDRRLMKSVLVLTIAGIVIGSGNISSAPIGYQYQYDEAVENYLNIKEEFPAQNWTIVSPVEEYHLAYNNGYHTQIWEFVETISMPEGKVLEFTTDDIFIFIEKIPLGSEEEINEQDTLAPFPELIGTDLTEFYYRNVDNRRILQAKAYHWAESYMENQDMTIYYDSPVLRVYWIHQDGLHPRNLLN